MNSKVPDVLTCWDADQVHAIIEFLGVLQDQLREIYGEDLAQRPAHDEHQAQLDFSYDIDF